MTWDTITKALNRERHVEGSHKVILVDPRPENNALPQIRLVTKAMSQLLWERNTNEHNRNHNSLGPYAQNRALNPSREESSNYYFISCASKGHGPQSIPWYNLVQSAAYTSPTRRKAQWIWY